MSDLSSMSAILSSEQGFDFDLMEICLHSWIHLMILMIFDIYNLHTRFACDQTLCIKGCRKKTQSNQFGCLVSNSHFSAETNTD